jgi:Flp pilus assembly protein TadB
MTLEFDEYLQLSKIARALKRSDPDLARTLSVPPGHTRGLDPRRASHAVLVACVLMALAGAALASPAVSLAGGVVAMTLYPFLLVLAKRDPRRYG